MIRHICVLSRLMIRILPFHVGSRSRFCTGDCLRAVNPWGRCAGGDAISLRIGRTTTRRGDRDNGRVERLAAERRTSPTALSGRRTIRRARANSSGGSSCNSAGHPEAQGGQGYPAAPDQGGGYDPRGYPGAPGAHYPPEAYGQQPPAHPYAHGADQHQSGGHLPQFEHYQPGGEPHPGHYPQPGHAPPGGGYAGYPRRMSRRDTRNRETRPNRRRATVTIRDTLSGRRAAGIPIQAPMTCRNTSLGRSQPGMAMPSLRATGPRPTPQGAVPHDEAYPPNQPPPHPNWQHAGQAQASARKDSSTGPSVGATTTRVSPLTP